MWRNRISRLALYVLAASIHAGCSYRIGGYEIDRETQIRIAELGDRVDVNDNGKIDPWEIDRVEQYIDLAERIERIQYFLNNLPKPFRRREED